MEAKYFFESEFSEYDIWVAFLKNNHDKVEIIKEDSKNNEARK